MTASEVVTNKKKITAWKVYVLAFLETKVYVFHEFGELYMASEKG